MPSPDAAPSSPSRAWARGLFAEPERAAVLAKLAGQGDVAATREFLSNVRPTLWRVVSSVLGARHPDLEDVVQQSMIALVHALASFRGDCHPVGYASRIALRVALRARRKSRLEQLQRENWQRLSCEPDAELSFPDEGVAERRKKLLRDLLEDLPEEQAEALGLRTILGWSLEETAAATGAPVNTIRSRIRLAKEALRKRIERDPKLAEDLEVEL